MRISLSLFIVLFIIQVSHPEPTLHNLIPRYEKYYNQCKEKDSPRCPDVYLSLSQLYYDSARIQDSIYHVSYNIEYMKWKRDTTSPKPVHDNKQFYKKAIDMSLLGVKNASTPEMLYEFYVILGNAYGETDEIAAAKDWFYEAVSIVPDSTKLMMLKIQLARCYYDLNMFVMADELASTALAYFEVIPSQSNRCKWLRSFVDNTHHIIDSLNTNK